SRHTSFSRDWSSDVCSSDLSTLRSRPVENKAAILEATRYLVWPLLASGELQIPIHERLPLAEAARAHEILRTGGHLGKVILEVRSEERRVGKEGRRRDERRQ